ncbi:MAG: 16S rRNA (cytosine(967)-C(5))-methyltransferase RsmB [Kiritimatiellae bacterium]|nr:16S rRNA (cytosine(967)-C(5))-methyltransferase RsmB [Kiritimatiellia bacterium]
MKKQPPRSHAHTTPRHQTTRRPREDRTPAANPRLDAAQLVLRFMENQAFPDREIEHTGDGRAAVMEIGYGVIRRLALLEWLLHESVQAPRLPRAEVQACALCGLYELYFMQSEEYAVVNETVENCKRLATEKESTFVNAVLRNAQRDREALLLRMNNLSPAIRFSHPEALLSRWKNNFGETAAASLCRWNNEVPSITIRPLHQKTTPEDYLNRLHAAGITEAEPHPFSPDFIQIPHGIGIATLPGYQEGFFYVQDPSTSLAPALLNAQPGETILDACAAPGGKTLILADQMRDQGKLIAMDIYADRLQTLRANLRRIGLRHIEVLQGDAKDAAINPRLKTMAPEGFDAILLDVPCSNTGVIRRRPDARWRSNKTRLSELARTQRMILQAAARLLRSGGRLVYGTCSLEPEENADLISKWLLHMPGFVLEEQQQLFPPETKTDGAYAARIRKL